MFEVILGDVEDANIHPKLPPLGIQDDHLFVGGSRLYRQTDV